MDEVNALLNKAHQRLQAAKELFQMKYYDDVNRAYYSMVSAATAALRFKDIKSVSVNILNLNQ